MELTTLQLLTSLALLLVAFLFYLSKTKHPKYKLPPSPPNALPIIGHLHLMKRTLPQHRTLSNLSQKYGPIFSLRLGVRPVVVVSSSSLVQECFTKNDIVLANRPLFLLGKHFNYNYTTMIHSSYNEHWRNLRRIGSIEIFSSHRLNKFLIHRREEVKRVIKNLSSDNEAQEFKQVELRPAFQELAFNVIMRMLSGDRFYGDNLSSIKEQREIRKTFKEVIGGMASNPGDFVPILKWVTGVEKRMARVAKKFDCFMQGLLDESKMKRKDMGGKENGDNSMIDHLLSFQETQPEYYTDEIIKGLVSVMLFAGTDTSSVTLEWAVSNLLNHPQVLQKAKEELDNTIGDKCLLDEADLSKLPYLQCIISETLRLHPAAPLLVPHSASEDCQVGGYDIPRGMILFVNAWDIHMDPKIWDDPTSFKPERFENRVQDAHKLIIPFGMGRRSCPGSGLAQRVVGWTIGALIQCFEWKRISDEEIDMSEDVSALMVRAQPLVAMCKPRPIIKTVF